uniref:DUF1736 domain-containing protein n=1 Tax=Anopheles dirus TaxID=7168 RepID=A0A182NEX9_9DIPT
MSQIKIYSGTNIDSHRVRSLGIIALSLAFIVHCRLTLPRPATLFSTADNPTARSGSLWTRFLTFTYLPVVNFQLLLLPDVLSFDWGMDAIPRIGSVLDRKVALACLFYLALGWALWSSCRALARQSAAPRSATAGSSFNRKLTSKLHRLRTEDADAAGAGCTLCKQDMVGGLQHHTSTCRTLHNNNGLSSIISCASSVRGDSPDTSADDGGSGHGCSLHNSPAAALLMCVALLTLPFLPASNLLFYVGFVVAERILYLPSVGYCLLIGLGVSALIDVVPSASASVVSGGGRSGRSHRSSAKAFGPRRRQLVLACVGLLLVAYSAKTVRRNRDWADEESLFRSAIAVNPPK